ncbi:MAG: polymorphic toxin type 23 domain-containing protein [Flavobacteriales bacterium]|nr:polymorphic toxin type 23 domain-containing protein [Flavobacteriales bacterium]
MFQKLRLKPLLFLLLSVFFSFSAKGQNQLYQNQNFGISAGAIVNLGSHVSQIGLYLSGYYYQTRNGLECLQINSNVSCTFNYKNWGPPGKFRETKLGIGLVAAWGPTEEKQKYFHSLVSNQTRRNYSLGYGYNFYFDNRNTSQRTGIVGFQFYGFEIIHENDILATSGSDRFRTAALIIAYSKDSLRVGLNSLLWTGNSNSPLVKNRYDTTFSRYGYKDLSNTTYGKFSNGVAGIQAEYALGFGQNLKLSSGIDSERIRNIIQNKIIHDMYFVPAKWIKIKNLHLPMLDNSGLPYLYRKDQRLKKRKLYYQFSINDSDFY